MEQSHLFMLINTDSFVQLDPEKLYQPNSKPFECSVLRLTLLELLERSWLLFGPHSDFLRGILDVRWQLRVIFQTIELVKSGYIVTNDSRDRKQMVNS